MTSKRKMTFDKTTNICLLIGVLCIAATPVDGIETDTYEFGDDCTVSFKKVNEERQIYVEYKGKHIRWLCDDFSFKGRGENIMDDYEICVTPQYFTDPDCAVRLDYKSSYTSGRLQSVNCSENYNSKFCHSDGKYLYIDFKTRGGKSTSKARFKLLITARKVFDYGNFVGAIVGGVFGGLLLISLVIGLICCCACRRKPTQGQVLNPSQTPMVNQPAYPYVTYSTQPTGNTAIPYPTENYPRQYPGYTTQTALHSPQTGSWQQTEKQASAPPPSYDDVTNQY
ncbi:uncharacterized protein LOC125653680 isoform X4 [Ostrea edulis]|uniref:uncharacterized protein LOC125653680 isoform X3 n=1 Tax=Ostrea edulis TaxID=37623 RepID=UPI0024AFCE48|nr:uncharacterized protein LOC125653680 isoform X3 [Ostrea edulis]XP_048739202.2 uncharacterized protein LOC125653680 isoform X4 [Ostrea edulis]XP_056000602.1 uncharacterized protein LOC125653680 isoform X3 [Ostrea edulis]XP_056000603.1 uncharacterized protein LOC125653680 isoform X4 [Ostrea edulis]